MGARRKHAWYQFSLKGLLMLMAVASLPPGAYVARRQYLLAKRLAEIEGAFQWLESLDYPDMPNGQPILVTSTQWSNDSQKSLSGLSAALAFLLCEDAKSFTILTPSLARKTIEREKRIEGYGRVESSFERTTLGIAAQNALDHGGDIYYPHAFHDSRDGLSKRAELLILAWTCARHGYGQWALKLYDMAETRREWRDSESQSGPHLAAKPFLERVAADFAYHETVNAMLGCGSDTPRSELLKRFRWLKRHFPNSKYAGDVAEKIPILEQMVAEDQVHARKCAAGTPFEQLSKEEQIEELIFQLRDCPPSYGCYPDRDPRAPFERLLACGCDAIPQLAAALGDPRLARSVDRHFGSNAIVPYRVRTIGEIVDFLLVCVAGRSFGPELPFGESARIQGAQDAARIQTMRQAALDWHRHLMAKGEMNCLIEAISAGGIHSSSLARHLAAKHPDAACTAILAAVQKVDDAYQVSFTNILRDIHSDESLPYLLDQLQHHNAGNRLEAADALTELGRPEGIEAMIEQWERSEMAELQGVGPFLVRSDRPEAIRAVAERFAKQSLGERAATMYEARNDANPKRTANNEACNAMIELLLMALHDTDQRGEFSGYWGGPSIEGLRICDMAGYHLNQLDPAGFPFDVEAPIVRRELARRVILSRHANR